LAGVTDVREVHYASRPLSDADAAALEKARRTLGPGDYDTVLRGEEVRVYDEEARPLLVLLPGAIPDDLGRALPALRRAATKSYSFGEVASGVVGYDARGRLGPYARVTPFTRDDVLGWRDVRRLLRAMDRIYAAALPEEHCVQAAFARLVHPDFRITGTVFTTGTVNDTVAHAAHRHRGNLALGCSVMAVARRGTYSGGLFVLPEYRLAANLGHGDVVLFAPHALHGNTPIVGEPGHERISVVGYFRVGLLDAGSAADENERVNRMW
jgi:hypothetical protein